MPSHLPPEVREQLAQSLRETLRTARESAALTQQQMARRIGLGLSTYKRLERGIMSPGIQTLRKLSQALCLSLDALLGPRCARAVVRAARPSPRRKRSARSAAPRVRALPAQPPVYPVLSQEPWGLLAVTQALPVAEVLPLLLVRRGTPLALVVDVG